MLNNRRPSDPCQQAESPVLKRVRKNVYRQAFLAGFLIILTVVILFGVTAAWYTNIVQSNDLVFKASKWGFDGTVKSADVTISAAPGDVGVVELVAESESDGVTAVSLNVSRAQMTTEMQKRIYFYIDTAKTRSGEYMERIYLGSADNYTYMLLPHETLTLTEEVHTDALLKWHWVYDVLGYYVQGTWDGESMTVSEYLRPIEYDYNDLTQFDANGNLIFIDASTSVETFLYQISSHDGYPGTVNLSEKNSGGYYPVAVDETTNTGVWAYLCNYSDIEMNTRYDTALGQAAAAGEQTVYFAKLTLSAQNSNLEPEQVITEEALLTALSVGGSASVQLGGDLTLSEPLAVGSASQPQQVVLDLNGKTLTVDSGTYNQKAAGIQVGEGSSLTIVNGDLTGTGKGFALSGSAVDITLSGVDISGVETALYIRDNDATGTGDSTIRLSGCTIDCSEEGIYLSGNGSDSAQTTQLIVEDTTITSGYGGIMGNGSAGQSGTEIQIINSTVEGEWFGVYQPQNDSALVISGSTISGYTGLVLKGGSATVTDSTVSGTGTGIGSDAPTVSLSGFCDTGDGIYIESNYIDQYGYAIALSVSGNSVVTSTNNLALRVYPEHSNVNVSVSGGMFSSEIAGKYLVDNTTCTESDGSYVVSAVAVDAGDDSSGTEQAG